MIKFKLVDNRTRVSKKIKELQERLEQFPKEFMRITADIIIENSPVDTGTYMDAHQIGTKESITTSHGKPHNQPHSNFADAARDRLYSQINGLSVDGSNWYITNNSAHNIRVEYTGWFDKDGNKTQSEYAPYTIARGYAPVALEEAKARVGL